MTLGPIKNFNTYFKRHRTLVPVKPSDIAIKSQSGRAFVMVRHEDGELGGYPEVYVVQHRLKLNGSSGLWGYKRNPNVYGNFTGLRGQIHVGLMGDVSMLHGVITGLRGEIAVRLSDDDELEPALWGDVTNVTGDLTGLTGDISKLRGNVTKIVGCASGVQGDTAGIEGDISQVIGDITDFEGTLHKLFLFDPSQISKMSNGAFHPK